MNPRMYRKAALDRLSSPDDLDRMLTVTSPHLWLVLCGLGTFVVTALIWSFVARIPTKADGTGVLIGQGGVVNVVTTGTGVVTNLHLKIGDTVKTGDIVATIAQPEIVTSIRQAQDRVDEARLDAGHTEHVQDQSTKLQIDALDRQSATIKSDIKQSENLAKLAAEQIPVEQRLLDRGLSTKQDLIAAQQKLVEIQSDEQKSKAQLVGVDAQRYGLSSQPEATRMDAAARVDELERQLQTLQQQMQLSTQVVSPFSGEITELKVYAGSVVAAGQPVMSIQPPVQQLEVVAFIPTSDAKNIHPGMIVQVSPTTVKREEYGYMRGKVSYVSDFPTTSQAAMRTFENVVNEVRIVLQRSDNTSGYEWSSKKSPNQKMSSGTLCSVQVVTSERRPIQLVMPFLKQFFNAD
jgi:HlyD family secretion protein